MHATERESLILAAMEPAGFVSYRALEAQLDASPATIRRDLARMVEAGLIVRVHGGAKRIATDDGAAENQALHLSGTPFDQAITLNLAQKQAIGRAAATLVTPGEGIMMDGGTTTFQKRIHSSRRETSWRSSSGIAGIDSGRNQPMIRMKMM